MEPRCLWLIETGGITWHRTQGSELISGASQEEARSSFCPDQMDAGLVPQWPLTTCGRGDMKSALQ